MVPPKLIEKKEWLRKDKGPVASNATNSSSYKRTETQSLDFTRRMLFMHLKRDLRVSENGRGKDQLDQMRGRNKVRNWP